MPQTRNPFSENERVKFRVHGDRTHQDHFGYVLEDYGGTHVWVRADDGNEHKIDQMFVWPIR